MKLARITFCTALSAACALSVACSDSNAPTPPPLVDAGPRDSGPADAGGEDSGPADAGHADAGPDDLGPADAGPPDAGPMATTVVDLDFEGALPPYVAIDTCTSTPSQGYEPLGPVGNTFGPTFIRCLTGTAITVTLTDLPPHTSLSVDFLFAAIDSLDGSGTFPAGDYFRIDLDGMTIFRESFANALPDQIQTYEAPVPEIVLARHVDLGFSGPGSYYTDSAYDMSLDPRFDDVPHTASTAVLMFTLEGAGVQSLDDESWALDNLRITTGNTPRERADAGP